MIAVISSKPLWSGQANCSDQSPQVLAYRGRSLFLALITDKQPAFHPVTQDSGCPHIVASPSPIASDSCAGPFPSGWQMMKRVQNPSLGGRNVQAKPGELHFLPAYVTI